VKLARLPVIEQAIALSAVGRVWLLASSPITLVLMGRNFSPDEQGFYFTFSSLIALQSFFELGFTIAVINVASHEWASLRLTPGRDVAGDVAVIARLGSLARFAMLWYMAAAAIFVTIVGIAGQWFLSQRGEVDVPWIAPWWLLVGLTGALLCTLPLTAILEGCGQLPSLNRYRLAQAVLGTIALWLAIIGGLGLWASPVWLIVALGRDVAILTRYRHFIGTLLTERGGPPMHWRTEIWPMQWRLAVSGVANYFAFSLFTPIAFRYQGPAEAGRVGMTLTAVSAIQSVATAWLQVRAPRFGVLISRHDYSALDRLFTITTATVLGVVAVGALLFWAAVAALYFIGHPLAERVLPPTTTALFLVGAALVMVSASQSAYLRAHKREPVMVLSVVSSVAIAGLALWLGSTIGAAGEGLAYAGVYLGVVIIETRILRLARRRWHIAPAPVDGAGR
jgi:O-antigen/teichoic acid export membrane protein